MDRAHFLNLAIAEWTTVHRFALRLVKDSHLAEDITQDVYAQALRPDRIEAFEPRGGGLRSWLLRITYRTFLAHAARDHRQSALFDEASEEIASTSESPSAMEAGSFDWDAVDERVRSAVDQLDAGSREVLMLWAVDRLQYKEIAEVLDIPIGTVMSRLHRARTRASATLLTDARGMDDLEMPYRTAEVDAWPLREGAP